jgi:lycopene beta-cyclase
MKVSGVEKSTASYDFLFIGLGAANCLIILNMYKNGLLANNSIAIIEPGNKLTNDKTFCFWVTEEELIKLNLKPLVSHSWDFIEIKGIAKQLINPLRYFHIKSLDLYNKTKSVLDFYDVNYYDSALGENPKKEGDQFEITVENETFYAHQVFDSRPPTFISPTNIQTHLLQSFYGWKIKTDQKVFDPNTMVMMDFNVDQGDFTQFVYMLPYSEDEALVELTRFGDQKLEQEYSNGILEEYIKALGISFDILDKEQGVIPMSSASINVDDFSENWIHVGARANMLKPSTGYAFHAMAEDAWRLVEEMKDKGAKLRKPKIQRFAFYDRLLLKILSDKPEQGKVIFETLFQKVPLPRVLYFMREKSSLSEEIFIFSKLPKWVFIQAALQEIKHHIMDWPVLVWPFLYTILAIVFSFVDMDYLSWGVLSIGFLTVGLSHGALDHLTSKNIYTTSQLLYFMFSYLLKGLLLGVVWYFLPDAALLLFIIYSAWHFGQADFKEWRLKQGFFTFFWGMIVLMTILFFHFEELKWILNQIPNLHVVQFLDQMSNMQLRSFQLIILLSGIFIAVMNRSKRIILTFIYLLLATALPLLLAFGIYFVGQHSINGWRHLTKGLNQSSSALWLKSLPFSIGGALLILYFVFWGGDNYLGMFFIILSCLSIPHVFSMHDFYSKQK